MLEQRGGGIEGMMGHSATNVLPLSSLAEFLDLVRIFISAFKIYFLSAIQGVLPPVSHESITTFVDTGGTNCVQCMTSAIKSNLTCASILQA
jgi:hypothetical protein